MTEPAASTVEVYDDLCQRFPSETTVAIDFVASYANELRYCPALGWCGPAPAGTSRISAKLANRDEVMDHMDHMDRMDRM